MKGSISLKSFYEERPDNQFMCEKKARAFNILLFGINKDTGESLEYGKFKELLQWLERSYQARFYGICHANEKDNVDGGTKPLHYHAVIVLPRAVRFISVFSELANFFGIDLFSVSQDGRHQLNTYINLQQAKSITASVRYLCHLDSPDKQLYTADEVITNDETALYGYMALQNSVVDIDSLLVVCQECELDMVAIMRRLGLEQYRSNRLVISDIVYALKQKRGQQHHKVGFRGRAKREEGGEAS